MQKSVDPPMLLHDRKFVIRAHVLYHLKQTYLHEDLIVLPHAVDYTTHSPNNNNTAVHISSKSIKNAPKPFVINSFDSSSS